MTDLAIPRMRQKAQNKANTTRSRGWCSSLQGARCRSWLRPQILCASQRRTETAESWQKNFQNSWGNTESRFTDSVFPQL
jgi:hypothetical protein